MRSLVALALVLVAAVPVGAADVTLVGPGGRVALSEAAQTQMSAIVKREAESCSISSVGFPEIFHDRNGAAEWSRTESRPHLYVRYETPVVIRLGVRGGPPVRASEVLIGIDDPKFPRQPLTRQDGAVTLHSKCSGMTALELMCQPALTPYFEATAVSHACHVLPRARRPN